MVRVCPLASGSRGNSLYVATETCKLLVDAGISASSLATRLQEIGVSLTEIDALLITHEHTDHIVGLEQLLKRFQIPVFLNRATAHALAPLMKIRPKFKIFTTDEPFEFGSFEISPFLISHDAAEPVAFTLRTRATKIGICTDLGCVTPHVIERLQNCDLLLLEANHEPALVHASRRPSFYKRRVLGRQGHLSNEECAELIRAIHHPNLEHVYLAHLSSECNTPEVALRVVRDKLLQAGISCDLSVAEQDANSKVIEIKKEEVRSQK